uniref:Dihydrolipoyl dehydrogenase n=1 Tax=candidate division WOR-3 bacterium TaxID=2052148 RepID=A0A7C6EDR2_UNCW3
MAHILVIGAGPGGYVAAIRLAQLGQKVTICDHREIGGVCLNRGCIPTKALLYATSIISSSNQAQAFGIKFSEPVIDWVRLNNWKNSVVEKIRQGIEYLFRVNNIEFIPAFARFLNPQEVELKKRDGEIIKLTPDKIIIATGSKPVALSNASGSKAITSDEALQLTDIPKELLIVGAGAVGLEFATIYSRLGSKVTVVEMMDQILPGADQEVAHYLARILEKQGIEIRLKTKLLLESVYRQTQTVLIAIGRKPNTSDLGLENTGIAQDKNGFIMVSKFYSTRVPNIYAIGDVIGPPLLAHKAMAQGIVVAELIAGTPNVMKVVPVCVYTDPELAFVGMTEEEARNIGKEVLIGRSNLLAIGRAHTMNRKDGMAKVIVDKHSDRILGVHILAPEASNLIAEATLALSQDMTVKEFVRTVHPHPTLSELLLEAAENVHKKSIHTLNR